MFLKFSKLYIWRLLVVCAVALQACSSSQKIISVTATEAAPLPSATIAVPTATPSAIPTATILSTRTPEVVTVAAANGNLFIRRGPDLGFNPISVLLDGQSATALSRDVLSNWLQIPVPGQPDKMGWVSIQSHYSVVSGDVMSLPEFTQTEWPVSASLQNCTHHQMEVDPLGIPIPSVDNFPDNEILMNPGTYIIRDTDVEGSPVVSEVQLREGSAVDIRTDGNGERKKCPLP